MPAYRVFFHPRVSSQLESHAEFIARVSLPAAHRVKEEFDAAMVRLGENPYQFPWLRIQTCQRTSTAPPALPSGMFSVEGDMVYIDAVVAMRSNYTL